MVTTKTRENNKTKREINEELKNSSLICLYGDQLFLAGYSIFGNKFSKEDFANFLSDQEIDLVVTLGDADYENAGGIFYAFSIDVCDAEFYKLNVSDPSASTEVTDELVFYKFFNGLKKEIQY